MADQPVTREKLINADKDVQVIEDFIKKSKNETVTTRFGDEIMTMKGLEEEVKKSGGYFKRYSTLAAANADIANIPVDAVVKVTSAVGGGDYEKPSAESTTLTKSAHDPLTQAKTYTDTKTALKVEGILGKNLFNKESAVQNTALNDLGVVFTATNRNVSEYIEVTAGALYAFTLTTKVCFYDATKAFISVLQNAPANVTAPVGAAFVRVDVTSANLNVAQVEKNASKTAYESFGIKLQDDSVLESNIKNNSISSEKIKDLSVEVKHFKDAVWLNMHDPATLRKGVSIGTDGVTETLDPAYDSSDWIPCLPSTTYSTAGNHGVFFYNSEKVFISRHTDSSLSFTTPENCHWIRLRIVAVNSHRLQLNEGTVANSPTQPHKFVLRGQDPVDATYIAEKRGRIYSFADAWNAWLTGEKFPICFFSDSTTNGNGTTGYVPRPTPYDFSVDYIAPNSYSSVLQALIREAASNSVMRVYNAGFSGQHTTWAIANVDEVMKYAYADAKMIGIGFGINDRESNLANYASKYKSNIETLIKWCLDNNKQPFLMTTQPTTIPKWSGNASGSDICEIANEIKKELADKWGLELIDVNKYGQQFMQYSNKPLLNDIMEANSNVIHFGNAGHKFTAELMFAHFCKRTIWTTDSEQLDYTTQLMKSDIEYGQIQQLAASKQGFKLELNTTQALAENKLLQDFYVFNAGRKQLNLTAYYANAVTGQYVQVDGVQTTIASQGQALGLLDLGLHKIKAYSGVETQLDWIGFKLI